MEPEGGLRVRKHHSAEREHFLCHLVDGDQGPWMGQEYRLTQHIVIVHLAEVGVVEVIWDIVLKVTRIVRWILQLQGR